MLLSWKKETENPVLIYKWDNRPINILSAEPQDKYVFRGQTPLLTATACTVLVLTLYLIYNFCSSMSYTKIIQTLFQTKLVNFINVPCKSFNQLQQVSFSQINILIHFWKAPASCFQSPTSSLKPPIYIWILVKSFHQRSLDQ